MKKSIFLLLVAILFLGGCAFQREQAPVDEPREVVVISGVSMSPWPMKTLVVGERQTFNALITPVNATNQNVTWSSSDDSVAKIDSNGELVALKEGQTNITVVTDAGNYTSTCLITVVDRDEVAAPALGIGVLEDDESYTDETGTQFLESDEGYSD